uniref:Uncharacterized protein n=1 Tax=Timema poppense TaxID=170557 RepID=A0A7R9HHG7_TIMPO|nr:unnamed protein product [Timema poppensis]
MQTMSPVCILFACLVVKYTFLFATRTGIEGEYYPSPLATALSFNRFVLLQIGRYRSFHCDNDWNKCAEVLERDPDEHSPVSLQLRDVRSEGRPLLRAAERGHSHLLRELLEHGLEADKVVDNSYSFTLQGVTRRNVTMLHQAARRGQEAVVELLLQYGAGADVQDGAGTTPIMCAADGGSLSVLKMLIERGARVNSADVDGSTALHLGARRGHLETVRRLVLHGADTGARRKDGYSALDLARQRNHATIVDYLSSLDGEHLTSRRD